MIPLKTANFFFILALLLIFSCGETVFESEKRAERAEKAEGDIEIGIVRTSTLKNFFTEGVGMAVDEINQRGGLLGRQIKLVIRDDRGDISRGERIAIELANKKDVIAVIGHMKSDIAIPASVTYEKAGIVFMAYGANNPDLTRYTNKFTFRNIPTTYEFGKSIAEFIHSDEYKDKYKKMVVFYERDSEDQSLSELFKEKAGEFGVEFVATRSYFKDDRDFRSIIADLKKGYTFDSVFIAGGPPAAAYIVKQLHEMEVSYPIISGPGLDSTSLLTIAGRSANGTIVVTVFNPDFSEPETLGFVKRFDLRYGFLPDTWAAQGYDAISVLAHAIEKTGSTVPIAISTNLQFLEDWKGVAGSYSFVSRGDIVDKKLFFKEVIDGKFAFIDLEGGRYTGDRTLRIPLPEKIDTIDPGLAYKNTSTEIVEQIFSGLTYFDGKTYEPRRDLAKHWEDRDDGRIWEFQLREDVTWTDGTPVTAHDVVWTIQRNLRPDSPAVPMLYDYLESGEAVLFGEVDPSEVCVRALDDFTVEFTLKFPLACFPSIVSHSIYRPVPRHVIEKHKDKWTLPENIQTNGPYHLKAWEKGKTITLTKNEKYYNAKKVRIFDVRYSIIPEEEVALAMYEDNDLHILGGTYTHIPEEKIPSIKTHRVQYMEYHPAPTFQTEAYCFNVARPPVDNVFVRKAISASVNRQLIASVVMKGVSARSFTPHEFLAPTEAEETLGIRFSPVSAKKWLAEAGYKSFPEIYIQATGDDRLPRAIQTSVEHSLDGIEITLESGDKEEKEGEDIPHLFKCNWNPEYPDANNFLYDAFHPTNFTLWEDAAFTAMTETAQSHPEDKERKVLYKQAEQILTHEEAVVLSVCRYQAHYLVKSRIQGWYPMAFGGQHIRNWYFKKK